MSKQSIYLVVVVAIFTKVEEKALTHDTIEAHKSTLRQAALDGVPLPPKKTRKARACNPLKPKPKNSGTGNETPGEKRRKIANRVSAKKSRNKRSAEDEHSEEEHEELINKMALKMSELSSVNATNKDFNDRIEAKQREIDYFRYLKQQQMINQLN